MKPPSSSPCLADEFDPAYVDPEQAHDVMAWRKATRQRLLAERAAMAVDVRPDASNAISDHLDRVLGDRFGSLQGLTISARWPIKAELNLHTWLAGLAARGAQAALPLVITQGAPLIFRSWTPETRMERGVWSIPVPAERPEVTPDITLAPVVGWDAAEFRLGYGGGLF